MIDLFIFRKYFSKGERIFLFIFTLFVDLFKIAASIIIEILKLFPALLRFFNRA